jgi:hypothetical protein
VASLLLLADAARTSAKSLKENPAHQSPERKAGAGKKGACRRSPLSPDAEKRKLRAEIGTSLLEGKSDFLVAFDRKNFPQHLLKATLGSPAGFSA